MRSCAETTKRKSKERKVSSKVFKFTANLLNEYLQFPVAKNSLYTSSDINQCLIQLSLSQSYAESGLVNLSEKCGSIKQGSHRKNLQRKNRTPSRKTNPRRTNPSKRPSSPHPKKLLYIQTQSSSCNRLYQATLLRKPRHKKRDRRQTDERNHMGLHIR